MTYKWDGDPKINWADVGVPVGANLVMLRGGQPSKRMLSRYMSKGGNWGKCSMLFRVYRGSPGDNWEREYPETYGALSVHYPLSYRVSRGHGLLGAEHG